MSPQHSVAGQKITLRPLEAISGRRAPGTGALDRATHPMHNLWEGCMRMIPKLASAMAACLTMQMPWQCSYGS